MSREIRSMRESLPNVLDSYKISKPLFAFVLLLFDAILVALIISYVPYTKIDWDAYMSQVEGFLDGERDYTNLKGDTGPLVYPAGFLYVYSIIQFITGGQVYLAQVLFGILYIVNLGIVFFIYLKTDVLPWWALGLLCLSKRLHSIFVLRLFNDCFAMMLLHTSVALLLLEHWYLAMIIFRFMTSLQLLFPTCISNSAAVSIKMNVLLYAPPLFLLMLKGMSIKGVFFALLGAASLQRLQTDPAFKEKATAGSRQSELTNRLAEFRRGKRGNEVLKLELAKQHEELLRVLSTQASRLQATYNVPTARAENRGPAYNQPGGSSSTPITIGENKGKGILLTV
uniref:dolichyl-P-Man:Man5GlcNAc2-PP-dolichol alpha-1,3-mannosyltransferase n=1 Tax=Ananas comosus var. bracteatus TaxID=296719 RepID=A0A6V7PM42_ANACO|nr:unnamed protein product [Ananas comosus var. bracteatus]